MMQVKAIVNSRLTRENNNHNLEAFMAKINDDREINNSVKSMNEL